MNIFKFIAKFFKKEKQNMIKNKYEIEIYDEDLQDNGQVALKCIGIQTVEASSPKELISLYKMCGQQIKILREIPGKPVEQKPITQSQPQTNIKQITQPVQQQIKQIPPQYNLVATEKAKSPVYYKIGDIEIKNDNGKIYQRQWIKLTDTESSNLRLINTKTNKIINLNDKHFEMKKWILVDENQNNSNELKFDLGE